MSVEGGTLCVSSQTLKATKEARGGGRLQEQCEDTGVCNSGDLTLVIEKGRERKWMAGETTEPSYTQLTWKRTAFCEQCLLESFGTLPCRKGHPEGI